MGKLAEAFAFLKQNGLREPVVQTLALEPRDMPPPPPPGDWMRADPAMLEQEMMRSLRDSAMAGDVIASNVGGVAVVDYSREGDTSRFFRKQNVRYLRGYAEGSTWVRAAIDIYRNVLGAADYRLVPDDATRDTNQTVERSIYELLQHPNPKGETWSQVKVQMIEDYLVIGHGAIEKGLLRNSQPYELHVRDAALIAMVAGWDGTRPDVPRYAQLNQGGRVRRYLADQQMMVMLNRPRSYDHLGLSHIETLDKSLRALLEGDEYLLNQVCNPAPNGAFNLGEGATQTQVDRVRAQIQAVKKAFIVMGGTQGSNFVRFDATTQQLRLLDTQIWFVRQVAAVFGLPTAALALAVDTSRANTESLMSSKDEGLGTVLWQLCELENAKIVGAYGPVHEHNIRLDYPIMSRKDEKQQSDITSTQLKGQRWISINEGRKATGYERLDMDVADEVLIDVGGTLIPLSRYQEMIDTGEALPTRTPANEKTGEGDNKQTDEQEKTEQQSKSMEGLSETEIKALSEIGDTTVTRARDWTRATFGEVGLAMFDAEGGEN
jgi:hypothetical protein